MATTVTIRDVPEDVRDELAARASLAGRSLQEHLRAELIELARRPSSAVLMAQVRARKAETGSKLSAKQILRYRDHDRR
jgi:plasmid stability protein